MPTNEELRIDILNEPSIADQSSIVNTMCAIFWEEEKISWHIGLITADQGDRKFKVDHVERSPDDQNVFWKNPSADEIFTASREQMLPCKLNGNWEMESCTNTRVNMRYRLKNAQEIQNTFDRLMNL